MSQTPSTAQLQTMIQTLEKDPKASFDLSWLPKFFDHTLLKPEATRDQLKNLCEEAKKFGFATVCVNSAHVAFCADLLKGTTISPIAVVGFPLGASHPKAKVAEAKQAIADGAKEIDMVIQVGLLKSRLTQDVLHDIRAVVQGCAPIPVKVILETSLLTDNEKILACELSQKAEAAFVKTSTGFSTGGATVEDIHLMRKTVGPNMGVKASGGIRTLMDALRMIEAGANRLGASAGASIMSGSAGKGGY